MADYLTGDLSIEVFGRFERHLSLCSNCRAYLTSYKESLQLGQRAFDDQDAELPDEVPDELVKAILAARNRS